MLYNFANRNTAEFARQPYRCVLVRSIATGDFDLDSDVEFSVVTNTE